jgi:hypothetical protein
MVKEKRKRGVPYLDSVDLEILEYLSNANWNERDLVGYGVLEVANHLQLNHNNLKPHIDKLLHLNLITIQEKPIFKENKIEKDDNGNIKYKIVLASRKVANEYWMNDIFTGANDDEEQTYKEAEQENIYFDYIIKCLRDIRQYFYDIEKKKQIDFDLRKATTQDRIMNTKVGTLSEKSNNLIIKKQKEIKGIITRSRKTKTTKK